MDLHEAHEVLGIDDTVEAKEARRAYLRLLKKHRPESDPEGFQRIREAHEIVASHRSMFGHSPAVASKEEVQEELPAHSPPSRAPAPPTWQEQVSTAMDSAIGAEQKTDWAVFFDAQLLNAPDPDDVWDLYYDLEEDEGVAAELLRAAARAKLSGFEDSLAMTLPQLATEQELVAAQHGNYDAGTLFSVFLAAGDLERAGPAAMQALDSESAENISGYLLLELLFALEGSGSEQGGPILFKKINEHIARELDERVLFAQCVTSWMLATEYFSMNFRLELAGRIFVGEVCRTLDWDHAPDLAINWRPAPPQMRADILPPVRSILASYAPTMMGVIFPSHDGTAEPARELSSGPGMPWWTMLFILLGALRLLRACVPDDDTKEPLPTSTSQRMLEEALERKERADQRASSASPPEPSPPNSESPVTEAVAPPQGEWFHLRKLSVARFHQAAMEDNCTEMNAALAALAWYQKRAPEDEKAMCEAENQRLNLEYSEQCGTETDDEQK